MKSVHMVAVTLLLIGGLNWGLVALGYNVVDMLLGSMPTLVTVVYALVGLSALYEIFTHKGNCKMCGTR